MGTLIEQEQKRIAETYDFVKGVEHGARLLDEINAIE